MRALHVAEFVFLAAMTAAVGYGIFWMHRLGPKAEIAVDQWSTVGLQASSTLNNIRHLTMDERKKFDAQNAEIRGTILRTNRVLDGANRTVSDLDRTIRETDSNLNGVVLPRAGKTVESATAALQELRKQEKGVAPVLKSANAAIVAAKTQISNPAVPVALSNIADFSDKLNESGTEILDMLQRLDARLRQMLKPAKFGWHFFLELLGLTGAGANIAQAVR